MESIIVNELPPNESKGSIIAKNGIRAEKQICVQENVKLALETYFKKTIKDFKCVIRKKYDIVTTFEDGSTTTIQNKDGGGGRGWSVDRRNVAKYNDEPFIVLLNTVCLKTGHEKPQISKTIVTDAIVKCLLGETDDDRPQYFTHTVSNKITKEITSIGICETSSLFEFVSNGLYENAVPKKTCVHLSPNIYLQRKGGGKTDSRPDDIQMKFRLTTGLEQIFHLLLQDL